MAELVIFSEARSSRGTEFPPRVWIPWPLAVKRIVVSTSIMVPGHKKRVPALAIQVAKYLLIFEGKEKEGRRGESALDIARTFSFLALLALT